MGEVIEAGIVTRLDIPVDRVLQKALDADLDAVAVVGWDKSGKLYFAGSYAAGPETLWLLALAQRELLAIGDPEDE